MRRMTALLTLFTLLGASRLLVLAAPATPAAATPAAGAVVQTATAGPYTLTLVVGPREPMYTPEQAATQHPTTGEVMLAGQMATPGADGMADMTTATPMGARIVHLELHVVETASGRVVRDARVTIALIDASMPTMSVEVPVAVMQGVQAGSADLHYGNNVALAPGRDDTVFVTVNGLSAAFKIPLHPNEPLR